jgi:exonuclease III
MVSENAGKQFVTIVLIALIIILVVNYGIKHKDVEIPVDSDSIKIANWNLQVFGDSKADLVFNYASKIKNYDIIFIQEIRDADGSTFNSLCAALPAYNCVISSRAGRTSSKEQYGLLYKKSLVMASFVDLNPDFQDRWERPPILVTFSFKNYNLTLVNAHLKPDDVKKELQNLDGISSNPYTMIIGDLNADCDYYNPTTETELVSWDWLITDNQDTTSTSTNCAYDRIIVSPLFLSWVENTGIYTNVTTQESDHYLIWAELRN